MKRLELVVSAIFCFLPFAVASQTWTIDQSVPPNSGGDYLPDANSNNNIVVVDLNFGGGVYGGVIDSPINNSISVSNSTFNSVYGGFVNNSSVLTGVQISGNSVHLEDSVIRYVGGGITSNATGGGARGDISADNNAVTVVRSNISTLLSAGQIGYGVSSSNNRLVAISSTAPQTVGGWVWEGVANNNYIYLEGTTAGRVIGGWGGAGRW